MECGRIRRAVDTLFFLLSSVDFSMSSLMQAARLFFSSVDIRRERKTRGMSSSLSYQRCQPIVVSATLELEGETSCILNKDLDDIQIIDRCICWNVTLNQSFNVNQKCKDSQFCIIDLPSGLGLPSLNR